MESLKAELRELESRTSSLATRTAPETGPVRRATVRETFSGWIFSNGIDPP